MRVNRLLEMVSLLLNRGTIPAREFADRFEVPFAQFTAMLKTFLPPEFRFI
jgi:predicted DNA-binding transcriptional regulator YafY